MKTKRYLPLMSLLVAVALCLAPACSKDNGDDDDDNDDFAAGSITFTPTAPGGAGDIWLELVEAVPADNRFTLRVVGDGLANVYGVAGRVTFDRAIAGLDEATAGEGLAGGAAQVLAAGGSNDEGGLFAFSRSGDYQHGADLAAATPVGELVFSVDGPGETDIVFVENRSRALDPNLESVDVANWIGGTLTVE